MARNQVTQQPKEARSHLAHEPGTALDQLVDLSWLAFADRPLPEATVSGSTEGVPGEAAGPEEPGERPGARPPGSGHATDEDAAGEALGAEAGDGVGGPEGEALEPAPGLSLTSPRPEADDDVHFGVAARALGVSRKTVERMVKRGELERGPSNEPATVSKRGLVNSLEARRRNVSHLARATEIEQSQSTDLGHDPTAGPQAPVSALTELAPLLAPLLDEFVAAQTRAAVLQHELERLRAQADQDRARDELLLALASTGWRGRRKTRQAVLRHYNKRRSPSESVHNRPPDASP
jgi:hypothetical protein